MIIITVDVNHGKLRTCVGSNKYVLTAAVCVCVLHTTGAAAAASTEDVTNISTVEMNGAAPTQYNYEYYWMSAIAIAMIGTAVWTLSTIALRLCNRICNARRVARECREVAHDPSSVTLLGACEASGGSDDDEPDVAAPHRRTRSSDGAREIAEQESHREYCM